MDWIEIIRKINHANQIGNLRHKIVTTTLGVAGYSNRYIGAVESREKAYRYVKKRYGGLIDEYNPIVDIPTQMIDTKNNTIWICWWQGEENAPMIVRRCIASIRRWCKKDWNIQVITKENYSEYVKFPPYIEDKWNCGIISNTHMSDLLRLELLIRYGGFWMDATAFLTGEIPNFMAEKELFLLKVKNKENLRVEYNNWLIFSQKNNQLLKTTLYMLYQYWKKENKIREYFLWHIMLTLVIEKHPEYVADIYYVPDEIEHILNANWFKKYDEKYWLILTSWTNIHKLTTKDEEPEDFSGTYYEKILKGEL